MRLFVATAFTFTAVCTASADESRDQRRQNLVDLSIAPDKFEGQTKRVFCPIEVAETDTVICLVLNKKVQTVGRAVLVIELDDPSAYSDILDNCAGGYGRIVGDDCSYEVDVYVDAASRTLQAKKFYRIQGN